MMLVVNARSVSEALTQGLHWLRVGGKKQLSRVGDVLVSPNPVLTIYQNPANRVLFSPLRDANPFFHVMESLWMLAGRNDLPWLTQFNSKFASYSDDGGLTQPGAYGYRWRNYFGYDQLETIIVELKNNPSTRRCVLAMWDSGARATMEGECNVRVPEHYQYGDLQSAISGSNDVPCNTHAYFDTIDGKLNMTVCCRSNDIVWGAYGANAVHFSFLLEYVAAATGLPMGVYRQFSNNYHLYTNVVPEEEIMPWARNAEATDKYFVGAYGDRKIATSAMRLVPLVTDVEAWNEQLKHWFLSDENYEGQDSFLRVVASPMRAAWYAFKAQDYDHALHWARTIVADDWRIACTEWLERRRIKHNLNKERFTEVSDGAA